MLVKNIILQTDGEDHFGEIHYKSDKIVEMPYLVGKTQSLIQGFEEDKRDFFEHSIFNKDNLAKIELSLGKYGLFYLMLRPDWMLTEIYPEPETLSIDIFISPEHNSFIYSFYNNTDSPNIVITAKRIALDKSLFTKLKMNATDLAFRQYILKKMLGKSRDKGLAPPISANSKENLTVSEVAEYLNKKVGTIYNWVYKKKIPYHKTGGSLLFKKSEIDTWVVRESRHHKK